MQKLEMMT